MNVSDVGHEVTRIKEMAGDDEAAHGAEDALWKAVLEAIRDGADNPVGLAAMALLTCEIEFSRWRA